MKLYFKGMEIGEIKDVFGDMPWMYGTIRLFENSKPFQKYFREMVDEDSIFDFESIDPEFYMKKIGLFLRRMLSGI